MFDRADDADQLFDDRLGQRGRGEPAEFLLDFRGRQRMIG